MLASHEISFVSMKYELRPKTVGICQGQFQVGRYQVATFTGGLYKPDIA